MSKSPQVLLSRKARGSGKTQEMIDVLCDAVALGQPRCLVQTHTMKFAHASVIPRTRAGLAKRGVTCRMRGHDIIEAEGSIIVFTTPKLVTYLRPGLRGFGDFIDHHIFDENGAQRAGRRTNTDSPVPVLWPARYAPESF